jgi:PAS domain S-box-containing protein
MIENPSYEELQRRVEELEEALRESREHYRLLAENVSDVIFIRDMNLHFTYISPSVERLTGYSVEEAMALTIAESYTPRSIELAMEAFSEELSMEKEEQSDPSRVRTLELEGYRKDGSTIWTEAKMTFLRDSNGQPVGILGVSRDITERKQIERAMINSEERYRSLVEDMPVLVCRFLPDGTLTFVNNSFCNYFGRKRDTLIGQKFFQLIPEDDRQGVMDRFTSLTRENPVISYEHRVIGSDGTIQWQHRIDRAIFDRAGDLKEYQCLGLDVTERKRSEELLQESEERFLQMANNIQEVFWLFDWIGQRVLYASPAYEKIWGRSREALYARYEEWSESLHPDDVADAQLSFAEAASTGGGQAREYRIICPDGTLRWISDKAFAVRNAKGEVYRMAGIAEDVTERKKAEEKLKQSEERLRSLSVEVMKAQENERSLLSRELHDELGQSLAILKHRVRSIEKRRGAHQLESRDNTPSAIALIEQIIEKVRRIALELNPSILDDLGLIAGIRALAQNLMDGYNIAISLDIKEPAVSFPNETARNIYRIHQEALTNIARHARATHVDIRIKEGNDRISFLIEDNGDGFSMDEVRAKAEKHRGLGLAIMEERAYLLGGTLEIKSLPAGGGTRLTLTVPIESMKVT